VLYRRNASPLPDPEALESRWQELDNPAETVFTDV
jgi:tRNA (guanine-N7-)-methyltransferase